MAIKQLSRRNTNLKGKTNGKGKGNSGDGAVQETRIYTPIEGQNLAVVIRILGGNHLECMVSESDGTTNRRVIRIPGKIRRRVWVRVGDLVVIEGWHDLSEKDKGDLIYRYKPTEITRLARIKRFQKDLDVLQVDIPEQTGPEIEEERKD